MLRIMLLVSGVLLCAGGLLMLAAVSAVNEGHFVGGDTPFLLVSVFPGVCLIVAGFLMKKRERAGLVDIAVLIASIVWLFVLTSVPLVVEM